MKSRWHCVWSLTALSMLSGDGCLKTDPPGHMTGRVNVHAGEGKGRENRRAPRLIVASHSSTTLLTLPLFPRSLFLPLTRWAAQWRPWEESRYGSLLHPPLRGGNVSLITLPSAGLSGSPQALQRAGLWGCGSFNRVFVLSYPLRDGVWFAMILILIPQLHHRRVDENVHFYVRVSSNSMSAPWRQWCAVFSPCVLKTFVSGIWLWFLESAQRLS